MVKKRQDSAAEQRGFCSKLQHCPGYGRLSRPSGVDFTRKSLPMALATRHGLTAEAFPAPSSSLIYCGTSSSRVQVAVVPLQRHVQKGTDLLLTDPDTPKGCWGHTLPSSSGRSIGGILRETLPRGGRPRSPLIKAAQLRWAAGAWLQAAGKGGKCWSTH